MKFVVLALCAFVATSVQTQKKEEINVFVKEPLKCLKEHCKDQLKYVEDADSYKYCEKSCGNNQTCWNQCFPKIQGEAAYDLAVCGQDNACLEVAQEQLINMLGGTQKCIQSKCGYEMLTLKKDKLALKACYKNCKNNQLCWDQCAASQANIAAMQVNQCAQKNGCIPASNNKPEQDLNCFMEKCPKQYSAVTNPNTEQYFLYCAEKCAAEELCWALCIPSRVRKATLDAARCSQLHHCTKSS